MGKWVKERLDSFCHIEMGQSPDSSGYNSILVLSIVIEGSLLALELLFICVFGCCPLF